MNLKNFTTGGSQADLRNKLKSLVMVFAVVLTFIACNRQSSAVTQPAVATATPAVVSGNSAATAQSGFADVVERVSPAVVTINSRRAVRTSSQRNPLFDDPRFREFFGDRLPQQRPQTGLGSGVIVSADGYILTNNHVVEDSDQVTVDLSDRRTVTAKVIGTDPASDLAVLKIEENNLPVLPLGDSDKVRVGDVALAIGNPLGVGQTVTSGIVSAKGRSTPGVGDGSFEDFIQTDAPINRGNSGGALINTNGELIGINSQILSPTGGSIGIGFAIPSNMAKSVMDQLIKGGKVRRSVLGVVVQPINSDLAESLNLKQVRGVIVNSLQPDSAAAQAGLRVGDVITALNGTQVTEPNSFRNQIAAQTPGSEVTLTVLREGREQQLKARLTERTEEVAREGNFPQGGSNRPGESASAGRLGLSAEPLTPEIASRLNLRAGTQGVVVSNVDEAGPAAEAGINEGDVIERVNNQPVASVADLRNAVQSAGTRPVLMLVNRNGVPRYITVRPRQQ